mmetsp:Transcript_22555/g.37169  ORF Transcript_22555/g.37169 Transcript_22555/m.37169 type:complete len:312 (+) Transcript_22555:524-1459(+)
MFNLPVAAQLGVGHLLHQFAAGNGRLDGKEERTEGRVLLLPRLGVREVAIVGLVSLYLCWVHAHGLSLHPHVLVQELSIKGVSELQGVLGLGEVHKAVAHVDALLEIIRKIQEVKQTFKSTADHLLQEHALGVLTWELPHHDGHHTILPGPWVGRLLLLLHSHLSTAGAARIGLRLVLLANDLLLSNSGLWGGTRVCSSCRTIDHGKVGLWRSALVHAFQSCSHPSHSAIGWGHGALMWVLTDAIFIVGLLNLIVLRPIIHRVLQRFQLLGMIHELHLLLMRQRLLLHVVLLQQLLLLHVELLQLTLHGEP